MKRFLAKIILFLLFLCVLVYTIASVNLPDDYLIYKTRDTNYEKIAWNINFIKTNPEKISESFVFLGPSLTQVGICDSTLRARGIKAINLGVNHSGNEIELYFLKRISSFKPKKVYLNLSKVRGEGLHPMTPLLYSPSQLLLSGQAINATFCQYIVKRASYVLDYFIWTIIHEPKKDKQCSNYGVLYEDGVCSENEYKRYNKQDMDAKFNEFADLNENDFALKGEEGRKGVYFSLIKLRRKVLFKFKTSEFLFNVDTQQNFVYQSFAEGEKNNFEVVELYIPTIMDAKIAKPFDESFYHKRTTIKVESLKDFSFLDKASDWYNVYHLSKEGAINFTNELVDKQILDTTISN